MSEIGHEISKYLFVKIKTNQLKIKIMKNLGKLKLNQLSKAELEKREMNFLRGGADDPYCSCGCFYEGEIGGSSRSDNSNKNWEGGKKSCTCECYPLTYASNGKSNQSS